MSLSNDVVLRPRFKRELNCSRDRVIDSFLESKEKKVSFSIIHVDDHVFIRFPKEKDHFWSPQLDLEVTALDEGRCELRGLFGPKAAVWTLFMFIHFAVGTIFIALGIWAYSNARLEEPFTLQIAMMAILVLIWFALYFMGRIGKDSGKKDMLKLKAFMDETLPC